MVTIMHKDQKEVPQNVHTMARKTMDDTIV